MKLEFSWRYCVVGIYKDRDQPIIRCYPFPFVRVSISWGWVKGIL